MSVNSSRRQALAQTLREARERTGVTHVGLAEILGINHSLVWAWEHAETLPTAEVLGLLAAALELDPSALAQQTRMATLSSAEPKKSRTPPTKSPRPIPKKMVTRSVLKKVDVQKDSAPVSPTPKGKSSANRGTPARTRLSPPAAAAERSVQRHNNPTIFIVHGHDEALKEQVARTVERISDAKVVILHEQADGGKTIIEKFEKHASGAEFAIVLLTPDDEVANGSALRARQNVILELGYFIGKIGRSKVCALYKGPLDLPSDIAGVLYKQVDSGGGWRLELGRELTEAGITVDLNRLYS
jgi:transcriptional regulator with XRE-family HTH domain/limonene-1,2-epoxide hydrolase